MQSSTKKTVISLVVIVVVGLVLWLIVRSAPTAAITPGGTQAYTSTGAAASNAASADSIRAGGTSDTSLDQNNAAIDSQLQGLGADTSAASSTNY